VSSFLRQTWNRVVWGQREHDRYRDRVFDQERIPELPSSRSREPFVAVVKAKSKCSITVQRAYYDSDGEVQAVSGSLWFTPKFLPELVEEEGEGGFRHNYAIGDAVMVFTVSGQRVVPFAQPLVNTWPEPTEGETVEEDIEPEDGCAGGSS